MKVRILAIGKLKEKYWKDAVAEYAKRLKPFLNLEILEGPECECPDRITEKEKELILAKEGRFFTSKMRENDCNIALDLNGKEITSEQLAQLVENNGMMQGKTINFLIGGSLGIDESVKNRCQYRIAFGRATFPHQMMRVFLTEQIYRCMKIIRKEPYHK